MSGQIHFVTPTNRWIGSIPLSTLDPLTFEPFSTYLRHRPRQSKANDRNDGEEDAAKDEEFKDRISNMQGQPVSLILARLQTTQGCSCGCTVPAPPKHSDYYHAQHILRLIFQTQKIRSRALRTNFPGYFERPEETEDGGTGSDRDTDAISEKDDDEEDHRSQPQPQREPSDCPDSIAIAIDDPLHDQRNQSREAAVVHKPPKTPQFVHSLIQNRALRNPLTNMDTDGDPTFFIVLEPGHGGWWHEPWAMATRPPGVPRPNYHQHQHHRHHPDPHYQQEISSAEESEQTLERIQHEKELQKERWRQGRIGNLELEAQHELEWRRWQRSLTAFDKTSSTTASRSKTRSMRYRLGKDITLLEPSERGLRLPKYVCTRITDDKCDRQEKEFTKADSDIASTDIDTGKVGGNFQSVQVSAPLDEVELEDIRQQQAHAQEQQEDPKIRYKTPLLNEKKRQKDAAVRSCRPPPKVQPWWDPNPQPFVMPSTKLSPFAISTLPEPVAKCFGGISIYAQRPPSSQQPQASQSAQDSSQAQEQRQNEDREGSGSNEENGCAKPAEVPLDSDTNGCKWVPVQEGDRVAVMIGTSKDFLLFPSFQRLLFRHLSREDFEDRVGRVGVIPCPVSTVVLEGRRSSNEGHRRSVSISESNAEEVSHQGPTSGFINDSQAEQDVPQGGERDTYGQSRGPQRSWLSRFSRRGAGSSDARVSATMVQTMAERSDTQRGTDLQGTSPNFEMHAESSGSIRASSTELETEPAHLNEKTQDKHSVTRLRTEQQDQSTPGEGKTDSQPQRRPQEELEEDQERQWGLYWETLEREDYDSSTYEYPPSDDDLFMYPPGEFIDSSSDTNSSSDENDQNAHDGSDQGGASSRPGRCCWSLHNWIQLLLFCRRPQPRGGSVSESRRARRRRLRRERWHAYQLQQRHQQQQEESVAMYRFMPEPLQRAMGPEEVHRCCMVVEFCRLYLTILMAMVLIGAIVYGAVQAEASPRSPRSPHSSTSSSSTSSSEGARVTGPLDANVNPNQMMVYGSFVSQSQPGVGFLDREVNKVVEQETDKVVEGGVSRRGLPLKAQKQRQLEKKRKKTRHHHHLRSRSQR
ncbi:hypothetical protein BC939DRAFT_529200 [Gamsiella multidivaricata]|uniref:uncharacterized protein n=1 Tax=Gamsiella multidivaricata TaxID=101098 RepID=UPI00221F71EE|nr:uncharacterized protein BC939DRAFT_529200 [Gamsiella multidivaricata]KAI7823005.1 hypothetical protein BC939DRAFT_529200 [Gamsiella multidivaricata]